jgi:hypothetical protein
MKALTLLLAMLFQPIQRCGVTTCQIEFREMIQVFRERSRVQNPDTVKMMQVGSSRLCFSLTWLISLVRSTRKACQVFRF